MPLFGSEVRHAHVADIAPRPASEPGRRAAWRRVSVRVVLLLVLLAPATAAIVYLSWPPVFMLAVVAAALWSRHLDREAGPSERSECNSLDAKRARSARLHGRRV